MNRTRAWLVASPVVAAGVLVSHGLAYRITATPTDRSHGYLEHAPQVLLVLALSGLVLAGFSRRREAAPVPHVFALVSVSTFVVQEHLERVVHGGAFPLLVASPSFLVGLLLQVPFALAAWAVGRWLLAAAGEVPARRVAVRPRLEVALVGALVAGPDSVDLPAQLSRGPPSLDRSR